MLAGIGVGNDEDQVGVRAQSNSRMPSRPSAITIIWSRGGSRAPAGGSASCTAIAVGRLDHAVGQRRGLAPACRKWAPLQDALALDAQHLAAVEAAQRGAVLQRARRFQRNGAPISSSSSGWRSSSSAKYGLCSNRSSTPAASLSSRSSRVEQLRVGEGLLQEMLEALPAAMQAGVGHGAGQARARAGPASGSGCSPARRPGFRHPRRGPRGIRCERSRAASARGSRARRSPARPADAHPGALEATPPSSAAAVPRAASCAPAGRAPLDREGSVWVCRSSSICSRCSTWRRNW